MSPFNEVMCTPVKTIVNGEWGRFGKEVVMHCLLRGTCQ
jgi:hypothetical protein